MQKEFRTFDTPNIDRTGSFCYKGKPKRSSVRQNRARLEKSDE